MGKYVENNLNVNEQILLKAKLHPVFVVFAWIWGVLGCFLLFIPTINAIKASIRYHTTELAVTNKRVIGKIGFTSSSSLDTPLNKIQSVTVSSNLFGKIFKYGTVKIQTAGDGILFYAVKDAESFKRFVMNQIEEYTNGLIKAQAEELAKAINNK